MPAPERDDDELLPLPPFVDEEDHGREHDEGPRDPAEDGALHVPDLPDDFPEHALDDAEARDLDVGVELDHVLPDHSLDSIDAEGAASGEAPALIDIGDLAADLVSDEVDPDDSTGPEDDAHHDGIDHDALDDGEDDGGAEGTSERIEDEIDPDNLPELDADDDGDVTDEELLDRFVPDASDTSLPPWSDTPWACLLGSGARVPCHSLAVSDGRVVASGELLLHVDPEARAARSAALEGGATSLALLSRDAIVASVAQGVVLFDPGSSSTTTSTITTIWRPSRSVELTFAASRIWGRIESALWRVALPPEAPSLVRDDGVIAMAAANGTLVLLTRDRDTAEPCIERLRSDDEGWQRQSLSGAALRLVSEHASASETRVIATAGGEAIALLAGGEVALSRDGGADFHLCALPPASSATFAGSEADAPLLALVEDAGEASLVAIPAAAPTVRLAEVGRLDGAEVHETGLAVMAWDASREVVWVACRLGLLAFGPAEEH